MVCILTIRVVYQTVYVDVSIKPLVIDYSLLFDTDEALQVESKASIVLEVKVEMPYC